ncbi:MAG: RNA polymerase sigma factor [Planctomycetota bacterium]
MKTAASREASPDPSSGAPPGESALDRDRTYLERWRGGDREAGAELLAHYHGFVHAVCARRGVRSEEEQGEVFQEAVVRLLRTLPRLRLETSFAGYLRRVLEGAIADLRSRREALAPLPEDLEPAVAATGESALAVREALERCRGGLSPLEDDVVELRFLLGYTYAEVAALVGRTLNHVGVTLFRAVRKLRECLRASGYEFSP